MDPYRLIRRLRRDSDAISALAADLDPAQARWKPAPDRWSILEVVCHLADEESEDFRTRLDLTLDHSGKAWPPIDPESWAVERGYLHRKLPGEIARFQAERGKSVRWLEGLESPDWSRSYIHPSLGRLSAADLLASWVAHDLIHIRQINRLHRQYLEAESAPGAQIGYAGRW